MVNEDGNQIDLVMPTTIMPLAQNMTLQRRIAAFLTRPRIQDLGRALLYSAPALIIFTLFTYVPFLTASPPPGHSRA